MTSEDLLKDGSGKSIGYELPAKVIATHDCGVTVEIRPRRNKSAIVEIDFFEGDFRDRPHASWTPGDDLRILVIKSKEHTLAPKIHPDQWIFFI